MTEANPTASKDDGFWISMAVLAIFGAIIAFGFGVAYLMV